MLVLVMTPMLRPGGLTASCGGKRHRTAFEEHSMKYRVTVELRRPGGRERRETLVAAATADAAAERALWRFEFAKRRAVVAVVPADEA
jgi:hypothetical protein